MKDAGYKTMLGVPGQFDAGHFGADNSEQDNGSGID